MSRRDSSLFIQTNSLRTHIIAVYQDDFIITGSDTSYISTAVNSVCQHMLSPTDDHFTAVKRILPYLKGTVRLGIQFTRGPFTLTAYSDADWAGDTCDRKSHM